MFKTCQPGISETKWLTEDCLSVSVLFGAIRSFNQFKKFNLFNQSISQGVLAQSPEPEAHDKVLDNNPDRNGIWKCWFLRRGEYRTTRTKTSWSKDENQQQTQPTYDAESENRTRATLVRGLRGR